MANAIKYSTGSETLALKKGNFYIGTGDVGKGPTSTTGYYNGITPPSGGYTIYLNKASGGPSIYTCANDTELISLTNQIAGTSYTTANECFTYYVGQTDKICLNRDYEGIVTDGLVLNLDAGFTPSYPTAGTVWYDLSGNGNNGTLYNDTAYSSVNGGSLIFDGVDDEVIVPNSSSINVTDNVTVCMWVKVSSSNNGSIKVLLSKYPNKGWEFVTNSSGKVGFHGRNGDGTYYYGYTSFGIYDNNWYFLTGQKTGLYWKMWVNDTLEQNVVANTVGDISHTVNLRVANENGGYDASETVSTIMLYNRVLSESEIIQNYNAQKGRFGL